MYPVTGCTQLPRPGCAGDIAEQFKGAGAAADIRPSRPLVTTRTTARLSTQSVSVETEYLSP